jgi:hypothetical protein
MLALGRSRRFVTELQRRHQFAITKLPLRALVEM